MPTVVYSKNLNKRHYHQVVWTADEDKRLCEMFSKVRPNDLVNYFGLTYEQIRTRARSLKLNSRKTTRLKNINHQFFSEITIESSYWAGFIMADGNIRDNKIWIGLSEKDKGHLEKFATALNLIDAVKCYSSIAGGVLKGKIYIRAILEVSSKELSQSIQNNFNVRPRKTLMPFVPPETVKDKFALAFIAGLIDGDGFINVYEDNHYLRFGFIGAEKLCKWAETILNEKLIELGRKPTVYAKKPKRNYWEIRCSGQNAQILLSEMQNICGNILLARKWNKLIDFSNSKTWLRDKTKII